MWRNITYERFFPEKNAESAKPNALNLADLLKKVAKYITFWYCKDTYKVEIAKLS